MQQAVLSLYSSIAWRRPCALVHAIGLAAQSGFAGLDLRGSSIHVPLVQPTGSAAFGWDMIAPEMLDDAAVTWLGSLFRDSRLRLTAISCYAPLTVAPSEARAACIATVRRYIDLAAVLGIEAVRCIGNTSRPYPGLELQPDEALQWNIAGLQTLAPHARALGVRLLVETNEGTVTETAAACRLVREAVGPVLGVVLDCANLIMAGQDPFEALHTLGAAIAAVHVKDVRQLPADAAVAAYSPDGKRRYRWTRLGEGDIPWPALFKALAAQGFAGPIVYEYANPFKGGAAMWRELPPPEADAPWAGMMLRRWWAEARSQPTE